MPPATAASSSSGRRSSPNPATLGTGKGTPWFRLPPCGVSGAGQAPRRRSRPQFAGRRHRQCLWLPLSPTRHLQHQLATDLSDLQQLDLSPLVQPLVLFRTEPGSIPSTAKGQIFFACLSDETEERLQLTEVSVSEFVTVLQNSP
jgi:hypothetical protein